MYQILQRIDENKMIFTIRPQPVTHYKPPGYQMAIHNAGVDIRSTLIELALQINDIIHELAEYKFEIEVIR